MKSHIIASSQPPPSAKPATAAMIGLRALGDILPAGDEIAEEDVGEALVLHLLDVGPGGEGLVRPGQHDRADVRVALERLERRVELLDQRTRERVQRLRTVEPDEADAAMRFDDDVGVWSWGGILGKSGAGHLANAGRREKGRGSVSVCGFAQLHRDCLPRIDNAVMVGNAQTAVMAMRCGEGVKLTEATGIEVSAPSTHHSRTAWRARQ